MYHKWVMAQKCPLLWLSLMQLASQLMIFTEPALQLQFTQQQLRYTVAYQITVLATSFRRYAFVQGLYIVVQHSYG